MKSLSDRLDNFAEAWRPKPGEKLIGTVTAIDQRLSSWSDEPYPIVTVAPDDGGEFAFHAFHAVAKSELAKQRPQVGERIGIAYHGKPEGKNYEQYRVIVEREQGVPVDWDRIGAAAQNELPFDGAEPEPEAQPVGVAQDDEIPF